MRTFTAVVERDPQTKLFVGYVPGFSGAHSQGATMEELRKNLREVVSMLLEDGEAELEAEFVGPKRFKFNDGSAAGVEAARDTRVLEKMGFVEVR